MVLYQICVFGADLKSNMAARVHNVFSLAEEKLTDGRRTLTHDKSSHGLWPGELKRTIKFVLSHYFDSNDKIVKTTEMFICEKILTTSGNKIYFQTIH
jgi:hypothetical protein